MMNPSKVRRAAAAIIKDIGRLAVRPLRLMEVCGTHTVAIFKSGIRGVLPPQVELVSGPGCPVCVTPNTYIDQAIAYAQLPEVMVASFGDMLRVPGTVSSLEKERAAGRDVRVVYSALDALELATSNPSRKVVFLAVGFETTSPTVAAVILAAAKREINNFFVLSSQKLVPPVLRMLVTGAGTSVDGFLLPGHVCAISGLEPYRFLPDQYHIPAVAAGFEPLDILRSIQLLLRQLVDGRAEIENAYPSVVRTDGNTAARHILDRVYKPADAVWRGLGSIPASGLVLRDEFSSFDASVNLSAVLGNSCEPAECCCGEVLRGVVRPTECPRFGKSCLPENPVGSCMVSIEGACSAWYKYGQGRWSF